MPVLQRDVTAVPSYFLFLGKKSNGIIRSESYIGDDSQSPTILTQNQKYHQASKMMEKIVEKIAEKPMALFETYMNTLKDIHAAIENEKFFSFEILNNPNDAEAEQLENGNLHPSDTFIEY